MIPAQLFILYVYHNVTKNFNIIFYLIDYTDYVLVLQLQCANAIILYTQL